MRAHTITDRGTLIYKQNRRLWVRLREKGRKRHARSCYYNLESH